MASLTANLDDMNPVWGGLANKREPKILKPEIDPFAYIGRAYNQGWESHYLYAVINEPGPDPEELLPSFDDIEQGEEIRKHFQNKLTILTLKGLHITDYQKALYELLENSLEFDETMVRILCKLPEFYQEDIDTKAIVEQGKSFEVENDPYHAGGRLESYDNEILEFVGSVSDSKRRGKLRHYYWKDTRGRLVVASPRVAPTGAIPWEFVVQFPKIKASGVVHIHKLRGYDTFVAEIANSTFCISPV